jgi:two-component sensor histidine kinase
VEVKFREEMPFIKKIKNSLKEIHGELDYPKAILLSALNTIFIVIGLLVLFLRIIPLLSTSSFMKYHLFIMMIFYNIIPIISFIILIKGRLILASYITFIPTYISLIIVFFISGGVDSFIVPILIVVSTFSFYNLHHVIALIMNSITIGLVIIDAIYDFTFHSDLVRDIPMLLSKVYKSISFLIAIITITILFVFSVKNYYKIYRKEKKKEEELMKSVKEKDMLLKEVHHRVKNNLQLISSLLSLQINYVEDNNFIEILKDSQNRIKTMGFVHNALYKTNNLFNINAMEYIERITKNLNLINRIKYKNISIITELIEDLCFNIDTAIPLGLIINEALSNSIKYAFKESHKRPEIHIRLTKEGECFTLIISDNGVGLPDKYLPISESKTMGLELISLLIQQIHAKVEINNQHGTLYKIQWRYSRKGSLTDHKDYD